jgi:hypothetical protein
MIDLRKLGRGLPIAVALAVAAPALRAEAAIYNVYGRVFAATPLMSGEPYPDPGLLADEVASAPETVLGSDNYAALEPSGMVRVQAVDAASGDPIADARDLAVYGAYFMRFDIPASTTRVRFQILEPDSDTLLHETPVTELNAGTTLRYLLTPNGTGVGEPMPAPMVDAALFTRVGWVEVADIANGFASFPSAPPAYSNAPFGASLRMFGGFSPDYYPSDADNSDFCYTIEVTPESGASFPITAPLRKRRYEVRLDGSVTSEIVDLGPAPAAGQSHCYTPTPISTRGGVFWSQPDLLAQWNSRPRSGAHTVELKLFDTNTGMQVPFMNDNRSIELFLDNTPVQLTFDTVEVRQSDGSTHTDLLGNRCDIAQLMDSRRLAIDYTARHASGFLARYGMSLRANDGSGGPSDGGAYSGNVQTDGTPVPFQGRAASVAPEILDASAFPGSCAYVINISAAARTTNGYSRPYRGHRQLFYYIQK